MEAQQSDRTVRSDRQVTFFVCTCMKEPCRVCTCSCELGSKCKVCINSGQFQNRVNVLGKCKSRNCTCNSCFAKSICQDFCNLRHFISEGILTDSEIKELEELKTKCEERNLNIDRISPMGEILL